jgi:hypothetical protein
MLGILAATAALLGTIATTYPALASPLGNDWTARRLPSGYWIDSVRSEQPVSCARGTSFCLAILSYSQQLSSPYNQPESVLVSLNAGRTWMGFETLPPTFKAATGVSCVAPNACGVSGIDFRGEPQVIFTSDAGETWTDPTPTAWANVDWVPNGIDCVSATTCWLAGENGPFGDLSEPMLLRTMNSGATWKTFTNLPSFTPSDQDRGYMLNGISCASAQSCVAVGVAGGGYGNALAITTRNGGATWTRSRPSGVNWLSAISCVPVGVKAVCYASGGTSPSNESKIIISEDGGLDWRVIRTTSAGSTTTTHNSISCSDVTHCWAALNGLKGERLVGTANAGASWSAVTSSAGDGWPTVSCLSVQVCVAITEGELWVTTDDGGLGRTATTQIFGRLTR